MTGAGSGGGGGYDYVEAFYPSDAEEGESLYHLTENAAFVYSGTEWIEQTVTDHSQLSGVNDGDHRSDQRVSDLAPVQVRYSDDEARQAVDGSNVAVEDANNANVADVASNAENADKLGGKQPSHFETPAQTGNTGKIEPDIYDPGLSHFIENDGPTDTTYSFNDDTLIDFIKVTIDKRAFYEEYQDGDAYDFSLDVGGHSIWRVADDNPQYQVEEDTYTSGLIPVPTVRISDITFDIYNKGQQDRTETTITINLIHRASAPVHNHPLQSC